jgi:predicted transcriptional regulator YdeE
MEKIQLQLPEIKLMGIRVRTSYTEELSPMTSKIATCVQRYWQEGVFNQLVHRVNPGRLFAVYSEYESDEKGSYTYFLGEEVSTLESVPEGLVSMVLLAATYARFTTQPAPIPQVILDGWYTIWNMSAEEMGGDRTFVADFEIYDERASNPMSAVVDIHVGIRPK